MVETISLDRIAFGPRLKSWAMDGNRSQQPIAHGLNRGLWRTAVDREPFQWFCRYLAHAKRHEDEAIEMEREILKIVEGKI